MNYYCTNSHSTDFKPKFFRHTIKIIFGCNVVSLNSQNLQNLYSF